MSECPYTFDDIEVFTRIHWHGHEGYVVDKGDHIVDSVDARHIAIEHRSQTGNGVNELNVHENMVNRYLKKRESLWVDFEHKLCL